MRNPIIRILACSVFFCSAHSFAADISWTAQTAPAGFKGNLYSLHFVNNNVGWAVGDSGAALFTKDGGTTWQQKTVGAKKNLYSVSFATASHGYIAAGDTLYETKDSGNTWAACTLKAEGCLNSVQFLDSLFGVAGGEHLFRGMCMTIWKTVDGGKTWKNDDPWYFHLQVSVNQLMRSFHYADRNHGWTWGVSTAYSGFATYWPEIIGDSLGIWSPVTRSLCNSTLLDNNFSMAMSTLDKDNGWCVIGQSSAQDSLKLINLPFSGPETCKQVPGAIHFGPNSTRPVWCKQNISSATTGWAVGTQGKIAYSITSGSSWTMQVSGTTKSLNAIYFPDTLNGWIAGDSGTILHLALTQSSVLPGQVLQSRHTNPLNAESGIRIFTLDGRCIGRATGMRANPTGLKNGIYIVTSGKDRGNHVEIVNK
jgi:photosystem II stability/assembly factor-like uncharacterized protein